MSYPHQPLRVVFAGTPAFSATVFSQLLIQPRIEVIAAYTQPDRRAGRGKKLAQSPVKQLALENNIAVYQPTSLKDPEAISDLQALRPDMLIVVAYGLILPQAVLDISRFGCVNVHASLLPRWRGAAPIERAIEAGDQTTGISIMQMDEGLDTGPVLAEATHEIDIDETGDSLREKLASLGARLLIPSIENLATGQVESIAQPGEGISYAHKLNKEEARLTFTEDASILARRIRAFVSANVCFTELHGERIKIWGAQASDSNSDQPPGTIIQADATGIAVACGQGALRLTRLQLPGGRPLDCRDILNARASLFAPGGKFAGS